MEPLLTPSEPTGATTALLIQNVEQYVWLYLRVMPLKNATGMANIEDPDQALLLKGQFDLSLQSESAMFAKSYLPA